VKSKKTIKMAPEQFKHELLSAFRMGMAAGHGHKQKDLRSEECRSIQHYIDYLRIQGKIQEKISENPV